LQNLALKPFSSLVAALLVVLFSYVFLIFNEKIKILLLSIKSAQGVLSFQIERKTNLKERIV
jgi:hypothetical protein